MSDTREWLEDIHSCSSGDTTDPGVALHLTAAALLAVLAECDKADEVYLNTDYDSYREGQFDLSARVAAAIDKALGVTDE